MAKKKSTSSPKKDTDVKKEKTPSKKNSVSKNEIDSEDKTSTSKKKATATKKDSVEKNKIDQEDKTSTSKKRATATKKDSVEKKKTTTAKKSSTSSKKTASTKKSTVSKKETKNKSSLEAKNLQTEYYDLPHNYNQTIVTILSQTPTRLFVYWEISEDTRNNFKEMYGEDFFSVTSPILIVYNDTLNYSFEVPINDFANSWYINVNDSNCKYHVELGRKPLPTANQNINNTSSSSETNHVSHSQTAYIPYYIYISSSNEMTAPNDKILFNFNQKSLTFRNIKNGQTVEKNIQQFKFITNHGIFSVYELYKNLYPNDDITNEDFFSGNPSSGFTSSRSFSSKFK